MDKSYCVVPGSKVIEYIGEKVPFTYSIELLLFYKVLTSGSSLMNKYADHAFNGILKVSFTIVGDSMSLYVILIGVTLDVFPVAYILERPFWSTIRIPAKCPLDDNSFISSLVVESPE